MSVAYSILPDIGGYTEGSALRHIDALRKDALKFIESWDSARSEKNAYELARKAAETFNAPVIIFKEKVFDIVYPLYRDIKNYGPVECWQSVSIGGHFDQV